MILLTEDADQLSPDYEKEITEATESRLSTISSGEESKRDSKSSEDEPASNSLLEEIEKALPSTLKVGLGDLKTQSQIKPTKTEESASIPNSEDKQAESKPDSLPASPKKDSPKKDSPKSVKEKSPPPIQLASPKEGAPVPVKRLSASFSGGKRQPPVVIPRKKSIPREHRINLPELMNKRDSSTDPDGNVFFKLLTCVSEN